MKIERIIFLCLCLCFGNAGFSQEIEYIYDNAGNRVLRQIYVMRPATAQKSAVAETPAPLEDKSGAFEFVLFPNPARDVLNISVNELFLEEENKEVTLWDMSGKILAKQPVQDRVTQLDFSSYTPGSYVVRMTVKGKQIREWKIIRE